MCSPDISGESAAPPRELHLLQEREKEDRRRERKAETCIATGTQSATDSDPRRRSNAVIRGNKASGTTAETVPNIFISEQKK